VRDAKSLRQEIDRSRGRRKYTFGVVFPYSSHNFLLRHWLAAGGINPDSDVKIVVVPAPCMFDNLKAGNLDGYCVGEPWNSVAIKDGVGHCVCISGEMSPNHPEKVLMVRRTFAEQYPDEHLRLVAALLEACIYCDDPTHREQMIEILSRPEYVNVSPECLRQSLIGPFNCGHDRVKAASEFHIFHRHAANEPSTEKAAWVMRHMVNFGALRNQTIQPVNLATSVFREDLFENASRLITANDTHETKPSSELSLISN
jgi:ABC-type nitrate/sulfonate/bicarbonate transport system substrate-binding protein